MQVISRANETIEKILSKVQNAHEVERLIYFCVEQLAEKGHLLYNMLTREMVLLTEEEWENRFENEYLKKHWFTVPEGFSDKEYADFVCWFFKNRKKETKSITDYTIFTTMDCNARCFYCFEKGTVRTAMSQETAMKVVEYIRNHCGKENVRLAWFGGEPLLNKAAIEIICDDLRKKKIEFSSRAVSNGYLFDRETVRNAVDNWNLKRVQITLDGTEAVYNKVKAYIYKEGNPYQTVMENIGHLLDAGVSVSIRLNMDMHNAQDLLQLVEDLAERFRDKKGLTVYAHHLFKGNEAMADLHTYEEWEIRDAAMIRLEEKIAACGLASKGGISKKPKTNFCMADSGKSVTILPDGHIGLCEHFSESEFIGHIDQEGFDEAVVASWKERIPEIPECAECFYYPECMQLKKCASGSVCFEHLRRERRRQVERQMLNEYERWKNQVAVEEDEEPEDC